MLIERESDEPTWKDLSQPWSACPREAEGRWTRVGAISEEAVASNRGQSERKWA